MTNPTGEIKVKAKGKEYRLHLGMSVLAELQEDHGKEFVAVLENDGGMPPVRMILNIISASLKRYHEDIAEDRWLLDDIIAENAGIFPRLMNSAFPDLDPDQEAGDAEKGKKKAAA